ncbi:hypothetical protein [Acidimangrovimonas sediminis]|uniref:hypothetical protein n=1 Tax=Acidimangrovimonas sediminis TaxID=2056283 RepID=UPI0011AF8AF6|nr:hypothetical protein [Acidimangrovimonas sediminis]
MLGILLIGCMFGLAAAGAEVWLGGSIWASLLVAFPGSWLGAGLGFALVLMRQGALRCPERPPASRR